MEGSMACGVAVDNVSAASEIEIDDDVDSALGDEDFVGSTKSFDSTVERYVFEHGRRYHGYRSGRKCIFVTFHHTADQKQEYVFPNDEGELEREDLKHHVTRMLLHGRLHVSEFVQLPTNVLDLGTGTGIWAVDFADDCPGSRVLGIDLSPVQPTHVPSNLEFQVDDVEDGWTYQPQSFDFIHVRYMANAIRDWPRLLEQAKQALKSGGTIELVDMEISYTSDDGSVVEGNQLARFCSDLIQAAPKIGFDLRAPLKFESMLQEAGYTNIQTKIMKLPMGPWPKDRRLKEIGFLHREQFAMGMEGIALGLYGRGMKWSKPEIDVLLAGVRKHMLDRRIHGYWTVHFTTAQRN